MAKEFDERIFDIRTLHHHRREKRLDEAAFGKYLKSLPDSASNADYTELSMESARTSPGAHKGQGSGLTFQPAEADEDF